MDGREPDDDPDAAVLVLLSVPLRPNENRELMFGV